MIIFFQKKEILYADQKNHYKKLQEILSLCTKSDTYMKLYITRDQAQQKGFLGGNKGVLFSLQCKAVFSSEEKALVEKYKLGPMEIATYSIKGMKQDFSLTINELERGFFNSIQNLGELQSLEKTIIDSCHTLKQYLKVASSFGGENVIDI